jgi:N-acetylneuraminic acid mutarotase
MKQFILCILIILPHALCSLWKGILLDGTTAQLVFPNEATTLGSVNFGLPHFDRASVVTLSDGNAYFMGGTTSASTQVKRFNPFTNTTTLATPMNMARSTSGATVVNDIIIVCGGERKYSFNKIMKLYSGVLASAAIATCEQSSAGVTSAWTNIASLPITANSHTLVTLNGKAYSMGGYDHPTSVYMYDGATWISKAPMSPGRYAHATVALDNDRALVCGGIAPSVVNTCQIYTASTNTWSNATSMVQARNYFVLVMLESRLSTT